MRLDNNAQQVAAWLSAYQGTVTRRTALAMEAAGTEAVDHARSYIGETKPGVKKGEGEREVHPGGWADITGNLKAAYKHAVEQEAGVLVILELSNAMEYAWYLERRGYWVLSGLFEGYVQRRFHHWLRELYRA